MLVALALLATPSAGHAASTPAGVGVIMYAR